MLSNYIVIYSALLMAIQQRQSEPGLIVDPAVAVNMPATTSGFASEAISEVSCLLSIKW